MSYDSGTRSNIATLESGKFVEIVGDARFPATSVVRVEYPQDASLPPITSVQAFPKYGVITYLANASDINIQLSAGDVNIGNVGIIDKSTGVDVFAKITQTDTVSGIAVGAVSVRTQDYPQLDALTAVDYATNATVRSMSAVIYNTRTTNTVDISTTQTLPISGSVTVLNPTTSVVATFANTTNFDAFGRMRTSAPLTLFDSSHRYRDNNLWATLTAAGGSSSFNANQGLIDMTVTGVSGSSVIRETTKVFAYQPGKSLMVMSTFVMAPSATNLRQRVGYFGQDNGIYFQLNDDVVSFVERSAVNGTPASETIVPVSAWNGDKLNGTGASGLTLDVTKAQLMWMDVEWLGLGTVRVGFVINGQFVVCHSFHHANIIASTYITTACLPLRYEITNRAATGVARTMKQVCSTVMSEGGYELRGLQQAVNIPLSTPRDLTVIDTYYPLITIRLKSNRLDAIVIPTALSILGITNNVNYCWKLIGAGTTSGGGAWVDAGADSSIEYKLDATSITGGRVLASGFMQGSNQGSTSVEVLKEALFKFQLERNALTSTPYEMTLVAAAGTAGGDILASMDWEEISR